MEKDLERLKALEKRIDTLLKRGADDRNVLFDAFAEAFFIYTSHELYHRGLYYAERLVELLEKQEGEITEDLLLAWSNLSVFAQKTGDEERAFELMAKVMDARANGKGPESKESLENRIFNANMRITSGDIHQAIIMLEDNLEISKRYHSLDSHEILMCYESLAVVYCNLSAFDMAESLLEHYLEELADKFDEKNLVYLEALRALSDAYELEGDYKSSLIYRKEKHRIVKEIDNLDFLYEVDTVLSLANTRVLANDEIESAVEELIMIQNKIITAHPELDEKLTATVSVLAECYLLLEDYDKASDCLFYIYSRVISKEGELSENARTIVSRLSYVYSLAGNHKKAIDLLRNLYLVRMKSDGRYSQSALAILDELGQAYFEAGMVDDAIDTFRSLVEMRKKSYASTDEDITDAESALASMLMENGEYYEAASIFQSIIKKEKALYGTEDEIVARLMVALAKCYLKRDARGDRKRAEKLLVEALESALVVQGPDGEISLKARDMLESIL